MFNPEKFGILSLFIIFAACTTMPKSNSEVSLSEEKTMTPSWFKGSVEEAFQTAKKQEKPIFLYWGAVWCPPCNEIKSQVFSHPHFNDLMSGAVPVYLDGDSEAAQLWADKLQVSGYPTLLVLDKNGKELVRIAESVNFEEFKDTFESALSVGRPFEETLKRALAGKASRDDWHLLAFFSWDATKDLALKPTALFNTRKALADKVPEELAQERALLASRVIDSALSGATDKENKELVATASKVQKDAAKYLDAIFASPEAIMAARSTINYGGKDIVTWAYPDKKDPRRKKLIATWLDAAENIRKNETLSIDTRLWSLHPKLEFARLDDAKAELPKELIEEVQTAVSKADQAAQTRYERHAVISGAAELLHMIGQNDKARALLLRELETTDTPWYYQSSLAAIEEKLGNKVAALKYSEDARKSAKGKATRLQWITSDLLLNTRIEESNQDQRLLAIVRDYYDTVFTFKDGFSGRNGARAKKIEKELQKWAKKKDFRAVITKYSKNCSALQTETKKGCIKHFASLLQTNYKS